MKNKVIIKSGGRVSISKAAGVANGNTITGVANAYGVLDSYNDITQAGAFGESIEGKQFPILFQHSTDWPIGRTTEIFENETGLIITAEISQSTQMGREVLALVKEGVVSGLSISFYLLESSKGPNGERNLEKMDLREVSVVVFPANLESVVTGVSKEADMVLIGKVEHTLSKGETVPRLEMRRYIAASMRELERVEFGGFTLRESISQAETELVLM